MVVQNIWSVQQLLPRTKTFLSLLEDSKKFHWEMFYQNSFSVLVDFGGHPFHWNFIFILFGFGSLSKSKFYNDYAAGLLLICVFCKGERNPRRIVSQFKYTNCYFYRVEFAVQKLTLPGLQWVMMV